MFYYFVRLKEWFLNRYLHLKDMSIINFFSIIFTRYTPKGMEVIFMDFMTTSMENSNNPIELNIRRVK